MKVPGWGDMDYYFEHVGLPKPDFGSTPDAEFPIITGDKKVILLDIYIFQEKIRELLDCIAFLADFAKTWFQNQPQHVSQVI